MPYEQPYRDLTTTLRKERCDLLKEHQYQWLRGCNTRPGKNGELKARVNMLVRPVRDGNGLRTLTIGDLEAAFVAEGDFYDDHDMNKGFRSERIRLVLGGGITRLPGIEEHLATALPVANERIVYALRRGMHRLVARTTLDVVNGTIATGITNLYHTLQGR